MTTCSKTSFDQLAKAYNLLLNTFWKLRICA